MRSEMESQGCNKHFELAAQHALPFQAARLSFLKQKRRGFPSLPHGRFGTFLDFHFLQSLVGGGNGGTAQFDLKETVDKEVSL